MHPTPRALIGLALAATAAAQPKVAGRPDQPSAEAIEQRVQKIVGAKYPTAGGVGGAAEGFRDLLRAVGPDGVRGLQVHPHESVAIQAAWEDTIRGRRSREWFIGFLEGRARVQAPAWWTKSAGRRGTPIPDGVSPPRPTLEPYEDAGVDSVRAPTGTRLARDQKAPGVLVLKSGGDEVRVPEDLFRRSMAGTLMGDVSALIRPDRCYLALHDDVGYSYELARIDRKTGTVAWKSTVFAHFWGAASGRHQSNVAVTEQGGRVVVFGLSWTGFHAEAFKPDDGACLFRFSTGYSEELAWK